MEANELRQFSPQELSGRINQWKEELFRHRFKGQSTENANTSIFRALRRDIARAYTVLNEKLLLGDKAPAAKVAAPVEDKTTSKKAAAGDIEKKPKAKKTAKKAKGE